TGLGDACWRRFLAGDRTKIFDHALVELGLDPDRSLVAELVEAYRSHAPSIKLQPDSARYFERHAGQVFAVITDGPVATQRSKIDALGLAPVLGHIVCSDQWGIGYRKPHPRPYLSVEAWSGVAPGALVYVADNPIKDFKTPKARGWLTVQIARPDRVHKFAAPDESHRPHLIVETLDELDACLSRVEGFQFDWAGSQP
ncbi:MAG: HAD family hydrolase, partial [Alphaproteobacteria bacterium]|nr:HAD family hydrolase [Alphaproteobacteria bacterium]